MYNSLKFRNMNNFTYLISPSRHTKQRHALNFFFSHISYLQWPCTFVFSLLSFDYNFIGQIKPNIISFFKTEIAFNFLFQFLSKAMVFSISLLNYEIAGFLWVISKENIHFSYFYVNSNKPAKSRDLGI